MTDRLAEIRNRIMYYHADYLDAIAADVVYMVARIERAEAALRNMPHLCITHKHLACGGCYANRYFAELVAEK